MLVAGCSRFVPYSVLRGVAGDGEPQRKNKRVSKTVEEMNDSTMAEYMEYDWRLPRIPSDIPSETIDYKTEPTDKNRSVQALRNLVYKSTDIHFKNTIQQDDAFLTKFLYARKFNVNDSYQLLLNYYTHRKNNPAIFENFSINAPDVQKALQDGFPGVLQSLDRKGRKVLLMCASNWDCSYPLLTIYRSLLISLDYLSKDALSQANGFIVIVDWTEFSFRQSTNLNPKVLKLMIEGLQDCFPARFKGIHFIGQPWYVEAALTVIKPFLKDKTKERIHVHGNNLSTLHDHVARDILPTELGGEEPAYNPTAWLEQLNNNKE